MKRALVLAAAVAILASPNISGAAAHSLAAVERQQFEREAFVEFVNRPLPDFELKDADGNAVSLSDFRGKVVVLYFIYATCPDVCPINTQRVAEIQTLVNQTPMRDQVQFIAITTDPETDTPEILRAYVVDHGVDPANYVFLTSGPEHPAATRELAQSYGLKFTPTGDGYQTHGAVTHVIDREGNLRARYHGLFFDPANAAAYVNELANDLDTHPAGAAATTAPSRSPRDRVASADAGLAAATAAGTAIAGGAALVLFFLVRRHRSRPKRPPTPAKKTA